MHRIVATFKLIISQLWQDFIHLIHFFDPVGPGLRKDVKELRQTGILKKENYISAELCEQIEKELLTLAQKHSESVTLANGTSFLYRNSNDPSAPDHGMLDISFIDHSIQEIRSINLDELKCLLEQATGQKVFHTGTHAYINKGIKGTRGYHIDNIQPVTYKAFLYLTDVNELSYGPYAYIKKSHRFCWHIYANLIRNLLLPGYSLTDMKLYNKSNVEHCTASKGTLILSSQTGIHRGLPQETGKTRIALIFNYTILSKLSYIHKAARKDLEYAEANGSTKKSE